MPGTLKWTRQITALGSFLLLLLLLGSPRESCSCGIYIPREGDGGIAQERALIRWDGRREEMIMELGVDGNAAEAAWIVPLPQPADIRLADGQIFDELQELTAPRVEKEYYFFPELGFGLAGANDGAGAPRVTVLNRRQIGPFDVASLAATEATALIDWLAENEFSFPDGLDEVLAPYVEQGWVYAAVKIAPGSEGETLNGALDPLWFSFETDELIYPMRPSMIAPGSFSVYIYVLAEHRVDKSVDFGSARVSFAGWVQPGNLAAGSTLTDLVDRQLFLTKFEEHIWDSTAVTSDFVFTYAASDTPYRDTVYEEELYAIAGIPLFFLVICGLCLLPLFGVAGIILIRRKR